MTSETPQLVGKASIRKHRGVWLVELHGSREEMATQYGALVRDKMKQSAIHYFISKIKRSIQTSHLGFKFPTAAKAVEWAVDRFVTFPLTQQIPPEDQEVLLCFADTAGLDPKSVLDAFVIPDVGQWMLAYAFGDQRFASNFFGAPAALGCSTFVLPPNEFREGFFHTRNLDYDGFGVFDSEPTVVYYFPDNPKEIPYASFSSLGLPSAGITGFNGAGLFLGLHQLMLDDVSLEGTPILSVVDEVLRNARSLGHAIEILKPKKFSSAWCLNISSVRENAGISVEGSSEGTEIRKMTDDFMIATNHSLLTRKQKKEFAHSFRYTCDSLLRWDSMLEMVQQRKPEKLRCAVDLISSSVFYEKEKPPISKPSIGVMARLNNIQSVVLSAQENIAYLAVPSEKYEMPVHGEYTPVPLDFKEIMNQNGMARCLERLPENVRGARNLTDDQIRAQTLYREVAVLVNDEGEDQKGLDLLSEVLKLDAKETSYPMVGAWLSFRIAGRVKTKKEFLLRGKLFLEEALKRGLKGYYLSVYYLFLGRYFDLEGDRAKAIENYKKIEKGLCSRLTHAAEIHLRRSYRSNALSKIAIDFMIGDLFHL